MYDDNTYDRFQKVLRSYNGFLERVETEDNTYEVYSRQLHLERAVKIKMIFDSMQSTEKFMQGVADDYSDTLRRNKILQKYPAAKEAWEQYKTIEALCNDE